MNEGFASGMKAPEPSFAESIVSKKTHFTIGRKITGNDFYLKEAQNIIDDFILNDSKFEINITDKSKRTIIFNFKEIKENELQQQEFKRKLKSLFDEAYNEVINSLFLNSYTNYIILRKNSNSSSK